MNELMIKADNISKSFGTLEVLHDISFSLTKGNVLSIIGPSGSGKSTLLRIITQLEKADGGTLEIKGKKLFENGQVATQYCDLNGNITMDEEWNVNGSYYAIEGITSPDGRVLGKMAHSERRGRSVAVNIYGEQDMKIFESGVAYFR